MDIPPQVERLRSSLPGARKSAAIVGVSVVVLVVLVGLLVATGILSAPTVENIDKGWGAVTNETTEIETQVEVDNPNPVGIPGVLTIQYTASLNDVVLTSNKVGGIGLSTGSNTIELSSEMQNDRIAAWWPTHINNGEQSTLTISPKVSGPAFSQSLPDQTSRIETDLLSSLGSEGRTVTLGNRSFLVLGEQEASWGNATAETTPLSVSTTVENVHNYSVTLTGVEYVVSMNNVTLGSGQTTEDFDVQPGETGTLDVRADLDTQAFAEWWPTHVRNNETSRMQVRMFGVVEKNGTTRRVPLALYQQRLAFDTDLLGTNGTSVEQLPTEDPSDDISVPSVEETTSRWGTITQANSEIVTEIELGETEGLDKLANVTTLRIGRETAINDVTVLESSTRRSELPEPGEPLVVTSEMDNRKFPEWWTRHVNNGERSTFRASSRATVDIGLTKFDVNASDQRRSFETTIVENLGGDGAKTVTAANETLVVVSDREASWGQATTARTPLSFSTSLSNRHDRPIRFEGIGYTVEMNDVTVADGTDETTVRVKPGETANVAATVPLRTDKLSQWWVSHLRRGEDSNVSVKLFGVIERDGQRQRVPVALVDERFKMTTDLLGGENSTIEALPTDDGPSIEEPSVENTTREWGAVTDGTTEVLTDVVVDNPNDDPDVNDLVRVSMASQTSVNGVPFGSGERTGAELTAGTNVLGLTTVLDNQQVPQWWARHINNGEFSTVNATTDGTVDIGFTALDAETPDSNSTFDTEMLAPLNTDEDQELQADGETILIAESTSAEWGTATAQRAPLSAQSVLVNEQPAPATVETIDYTVSINGIVLADGTHAENTIIGPGQRETIGLPMVLDNSKMDQWWVTHIRNDEQSLLDVEATATVSVGGRQRTVPLDMFSQNQTIETDILGE